jgi:hypothetical protein
MCGAGPQGKSFRSWDKMLLLRPEADAGGAAPAGNAPDHLTGSRYQYL